MAYQKPIRFPYFRDALDRLEDAIDAFIPIALTLFLLAIVYGAGFIAGINDGHNTAQINLAHCGELICPLQVIGPVQ